MIQEADTYQEIMGNDQAGDIDVPDIVNNGRGDFTQVYYPRKYLALADSGSCMWQEGNTHKREQSTHTRKEHTHKMLQLPMLGYLV
jgi:hypothetical protein